MLQATHSLPELPRQLSVCGGQYSCHVAVKKKWTCFETCQRIHFRSKTCNLDHDEQTLLEAMESYSTRHDKTLLILGINEEDMASVGHQAQEREQATNESSFMFSKGRSNSSQPESEDTSDDNLCLRTDGVQT
jgi:hypothetical protein